MTALRHDDPGLSVADLMDRWPETVAVFRRNGMSCPDCPVARFFTCAEACAEYELNADAFMDELTLAISRPRHPRRSGPERGRGSP